MLITWHIFPVVSLIFLNSDRTLLCFHRPTHPTETTLGVLFNQKHPQLIDEPSWHLRKQTCNKGLPLFTCHKLCPSQLSHLCHRWGVWMSVLTLYLESFDLWLMATRIIRLLRKNNVLTQQLQWVKLSVLIDGVQVPTAPWKISDTLPQVDQLNTCSQLQPKTNKCSVSLNKMLTA